MKIRLSLKRKLYLSYIIFALIMANIIYLLYDGYFINHTILHKNASESKKNGFFESFELDSIEFRFNLLNKKFSLNNILIVKLDDATISKFGRMIPRDLYGYLIQKAKENGAKVVAFDVQFPDYNPEDPRDQYFYQNINDFKNVVLAYYISNDPLIGDMYPANEFLLSNAKIGFINVDSELNNKVFGINLLQIKPGEKEGETKLLPSFPLAVYSTLYNIDNIDQYIHENYKTYKGKLLINYAGPKNTFNSISIVDILNDNFNFSVLKDKILLVGSTYPTAQDFYMTPFHSLKGKNSVSTAGVEIHANALNTLINKNNLLRESYSYPIFILLSLLIIILMFPSFKILLTFVIAILQTIIFSIIVYYSFKNDIVIDVVPVILFIFLSYITSISFKIVFENLEKKRIQGIFGKYLDPTVVSKLVTSNLDIKVGGETKLLSIFFSDIANFTNISERLTPEKLVELLNDYFNRMVGIVIKNHGIIDKFIGDAIMALYSTPIQDEFHADNILKSALEMRVVIDELKPKWLEATGLDFNARIGINSGEVVVGNFGSDKTLSYTAIGDHVNLASRLEGVNKYLGSNIIISEYTYALLKNRDNFLLRELDLIRVKGKDFPVKIYEALGFNSPENNHLKEKIHSFERGLSFYRDKDFKNALEIFSSIKNDPPSAIYAERCEKFITNPPSEGWDKVFDLKEK